MSSSCIVEGLCPLLESYTYQRWTDVTMYNRGRDIFMCWLWRVSTWSIIISLSRTLSTKFAPLSDLLNLCFLVIQFLASLRISCFQHVYPPQAIYWTICLGGFTKMDAVPSHYTVDPRVLSLQIKAVYSHDCWLHLGNMSRAVSIRATAPSIQIFYAQFENAP